MKKSLTLIFMLAAIVLVLAACGSNKNSSNAGSTNSGVEETGAAASTEVVITAKNFEFDQPVYKIKKGEATKITLELSQGVHGIVIPDLDNKTIDGGKSTVVTFDKAGEYDFKCSVMCGTGHSKMTAKFVVE